MAVVYAILNHYNTVDGYSSFQLDGRVLSAEFYKFIHPNIIQTLYEYSHELCVYVAPNFIPLEFLLST